jgi:hypothetical protein
LGQFKAAPAGAPPSELAPEVGATLQKDGTKILNSDGSVNCEIWLRTGAPAAGKAAEDNATITSVAQGSLMGAIRFPVKGSDRRGQPIKGGVYTLRLSFHPTNGDHQGVAPQRDFLLMTPAEADKDPNATPKFDDLVAMSRKASGTPHPAVLSLWKVDADFKPGFAKMGDNDWVLQTKIADLQVAIILIGKAEG